MFSELDGPHVVLDSPASAGHWTPCRSPRSLPHFVPLSFLPELKTQQLRTGQLIGERRAAFKTQTGQDMSPENVWLAGRLQEQDALGRIIVTIEQTRLADGSVQAVRGAGVAARTDAITAGQDGGNADAR